ncbi:hypothetical protein BJ684DRAFT_14715 [Piptocephalis cylindrospora]|uniref:Protein kinase domain-containing protein n=1 Tax=Piptocephalis cylindrospora TaxID=1907219 RepID=A0A4P9YAA0_9FUNG|nr:hypothetical protein BJ684DRAFT_14715 [Piptocephalis cylindrospora]|eukprot:RKP14990.1 hypothetical protein BJ684DRAFT_14715 [Piptocephalis cylindrospora]
MSSSLEHDVIVWGGSMVTLTCRTGQPLVRMTRSSFFNTQHFRIFTQAHIHSISIPFLPFFTMEDSSDAQGLARLAVGDTFADDYIVTEDWSATEPTMVCKAKNLFNDGAVAIKFYQNKERFQKELTILYEMQAAKTKMSRQDSFLTTDNIVNMLDTLEEEDDEEKDQWSPFDVIIFDLGKITLQAYGEGTKFLESSFQPIFKDISDGLEALHSLGIVHGNFQPKNIMRFDVPGSPPAWKLIDFQHSSRVGEDVSHCTVEYSAPEIYAAKSRGDVIKASTIHDMFSLGQVLHWMSSKRNIWTDISADEDEELGKAELLMEFTDFDIRQNDFDSRSTYLLVVELLRKDAIRRMTMERMKNRPIYPLDQPERFMPKSAQTKLDASRGMAVNYPALLKHTYFRRLWRKHNWQDSTSVLQLETALRDILEGDDEAVNCIRPFLEVCGVEYYQEITAEKGNLMFPGKVTLVPLANWIIYRVHENQTQKHILVDGIRKQLRKCLQVANFDYYYHEKKFNRAFGRLEALLKCLERASFLRKSMAQRVLDIVPEDEKGLLPAEEKYPFEEMSKQIQIITQLFEDGTRAMLWTDKSDVSALGERLDVWTDTLSDVCRTFPSVDIAQADVIGTMEENRQDATDDKRALGKRFEAIKSLMNPSTESPDRIKALVEVAMKGSSNSPAEADDTLIQRAEAMRDLALFYYGGHGSIAPNMGHALFWAKCALFSKSPDAYTLAGLLILELSSSSTHPIKSLREDMARRLLQTAVDLGSTRALPALASMWEVAQGSFTADPDKAVLLYIQAIEEGGLVVAMEALTRYYLACNQSRRALSWGEKAIAEGSVVVGVRLGDAFRHGHAGLTIDPVKAFYYYKEAVDRYHFLESNSPPDPLKCLTQDRCRRQDQVEPSDALVRLGEMYYLGLGTTLGRADGLSQWKEAEEVNGDAKAHLVFDQWKAYEARRKKMSGVVPFMQGEGERLDQSGDPSEDALAAPTDTLSILNAYRGTTQTGSALGNLACGYCYYRGIGCEVDYHKARQYLEQAIQLGSDRALTLIGILLFDARYPQRNAEEAMRRFKEADERGDPMGRTMRAILLYHGECGARDEESALATLREMADGPVHSGVLSLEWCHRLDTSQEAGEPEAMYALGRYYQAHSGPSFLPSPQREEKRGLEMQEQERRTEGLSKAWMYFSRAAHLNHADAAFAAYQCCRYGEGVGANDVMARQYLALATFLGLPEAQELARDAGLPNTLLSSPTPAGWAEIDSQVVPASFRTGGSWEQCPSRGRSVLQLVSNFLRHFRIGPYRRASSTKAFSQGGLFLPSHKAFSLTYEAEGEECEERRFRLLLQASDLGCARAIALLAHCYEYGVGTKKNPGMGKRLRFQYSEVEFSICRWRQPPAFLAASYPQASPIRQGTT